jgi:hypothetical protein
VESERWVFFRSWYGFEAFYCEKGLAGAHEKGGVEGAGGRFRRTHPVPVPTVDSLAELNERLAAYDEADDARRIANRATTVGRDFAAEAPLLRALPGEPFEPGLTLTPRVDRYAQVMVRQCRYPVPVRLIGRRVRVLPRAGELLISEGERWWPGPSAAPPRAMRYSRWTTTWRCWCASPARSPVPRRWPRPANRGCSQPRTRRSG